MNLVSDSRKEIYIVLYDFVTRELTTVPIVGTLVLKMSAMTASPNIAAALFGQTRRLILSLLWGHPDEAYYLRQLARSTGTGLGAVQREIARLTQAGIVKRTVRGRQAFYQANPNCPIFAELKGLVVKTSGVADVLRTALAALEARIEVAFIYGSVARLEQKSTSDVDVMVVGDASFSDVVSALANSQETLGREVNPTVYSPADFKAKLKARHHFLTTVVRRDKVFLIGDENELARLGAKRLADETRQ